MTRSASIAACLTALFALAGTGELARALPDPPTAHTEIDYLLDPRRPAHVRELRLTLASSDVRELRARLGRGSWIRCDVVGRIARCPVAPSEGSVETLRLVSVVATW